MLPTNTGRGVDRIEVTVAAAEQHQATGADR
jgi:hypothetical protein